MSWSVTFGPVAKASVHAELEQKCATLAADQEEQFRAAIAAVVVLLPTIGDTQAHVRGTLSGHVPSGEVMISLRYTTPPPTPEKIPYPDADAQAVAEEAVWEGVEDGEFAQPVGPI